MLRVWRRIYDFHPHFLLLYVADVVLFLIGGLAAFGPERWFSSESLEAVNAVAPPEVWSAVMLAVAAGLAAGLFRSSFGWSRTFLAAGFMVALLRALLLGLTVATGESTFGLSFAPWVFVAASLAVQTMEPVSK